MNMTDSCMENYTPDPNRSNALIPISRGEEQCAPGHFWGAGVRSFFLIHYVIDGKGVFYCGTEKYHLHKGQIFVIFPGTIVKYQADDETPWHYTWVNFIGEEAGEILKQAGFSVRCPVRDMSRQDLLSLFRTMPLERSENTRDNLLFTAKLYELMSFLQENKVHSVSSGNPYFSMAVQYIAAHYYGEITVEQISDHIGISRKYLFAIFKKAAGISPQEYLLRYRMDRACEFLRDRNLSIGHVAYSVGYRDPLAFSRIFRKKIGLSPREYREQADRKK